jgi:hypothetical protein
MLLFYICSRDYHRKKGLRAWAWQDVQAPTPGFTWATGRIALGTSVNAARTRANASDPDGNIWSGATSSAGYWATRAAPAVGIRPPGRQAWARQMIGPSGTSAARMRPGRYDGRPVALTWISRLDKRQDAQYDLAERRHLDSKPIAAPGGPISGASAWISGSPVPAGPPGSRRRRLASRSPPRSRWSGGGRSDGHRNPLPRPIPAGAR